MAIQFRCPGCEQPIEIDDQWANQNVACPFCHRVVQAPGTSTLTIESVPTAAAASPEGAPTPGPDRDDAPTTPGGFGSTPPPPPGEYAEGGYTGPPGTGSGHLGSMPGVLPADPIGRIAMVCAILAWVLIVVAATLMGPTYKRLLQTVPQDASFAEQQRVMNDELQRMVEEDPKLQLRALFGVVAAVLAEVCGLVGLILGIVGLWRHGRNKTPALVATIAAAAFLPGQCLLMGIVMAMS